jgi:Ca2+-binding RTX toxin-like protein
MRTARPVGAAALATTMLGAGLALLAVPAHAQAPITCQGKAATVVGTTGTEGDDVMVVVPVEGTTAQALGGNDTICIVAAPEDGTRSVVVDAGPGDDTVVNESADVDSVWYTTILGPGADSYVGLDAVIPDAPQATPFYETVFAGVRDLTGSLQGQLDVDTDVIDTRGGDDVVHSGTTAPGATNNDTIALGTGDDTLHWSGEQRSGTVDLGDGENALHVGPGWQGASATISGPARAALLDGRTVLRWTGPVSFYDLRLDTRDQVFAGTNADETLVLARGTTESSAGTVSGRRVVEMGGGDDVLALYSMGTGRVNGGPGRDSYSGDGCTTAAVRIGGSFDCVQGGASALRHTFDFDDFEDLLLQGGDVTVRGSDADEKIKVVASVRIGIRGRAGDDVLNANVSGRVRGAGRVVLTGGAGADRLVGSGAEDRLLGGRGDDKLFGEGRGDTLIGGPGRDKTFGQQGRDRCSGEVQRSCER